MPPGKLAPTPQRAPRERGGHHNLCRPLGLVAPTGWVGKLLIAAQAHSARVALPAELDLNYYFAVRESRKARSDHCTSISGRILQLLPDPMGPSLVDDSVTVHTEPDGDIYLNHGKRPIPYRPVLTPAAAPAEPTRKAARRPRPADPRAAARRRAWLFAGTGQSRLDRKEAVGVP